MKQLFGFAPGAIPNFMPSVAILQDWAHSKEHLSSPSLNKRKFKIIRFIEYTLIRKSASLRNMISFPRNLELDSPLIYSVLFKPSYLMYIYKISDFLFR